MQEIPAMLLQVAETPEAAEAAEGTTDAATPDVAPESAVEPDHG